MSDPDTILLEAEEVMEKALDYLRNELRGIRTGRASPGMIEFVKVDYYGSMTELKSLAAISVPEPTQLLVKPFDQGSIGAIKQAIEAAQLGFNPISEGKQLRINVPALSADRRQQYVARVRKMGEEQKVAIRNVRRDANKHAEGLAKQVGVHFSEDDIEQLKKEVQDLLKKYEDLVDKAVEAKCTEITTI
ncbi:MAG: ribosome recycling factor [Planctomycetota bacterium]|nr:ribosome recycling factor [Planctomycetota bacterium]